MASKKPIIVDILADSVRAQNMLQMAIERQGAPTCAVATSATADILILDCEGTHMKNTWAKYHQRHRERPTLVLSYNDSIIEQLSALDSSAVLTYLRKPFRVKTLIETLQVMKNDADAANRSTDTEIEGKTTPKDAKRRRKANYAKDQSKSVARSSAPLSESYVSRKLGSREKTADDREVSIPVEGETSKTLVLEPSQANSRVFDKLAAKDRQAIWVKDKSEEQSAEKFRHICGLSDDIDFDDEQQVNDLRLACDELLLGHLQKALAVVLRDKKRVCMGVKGGHHFCIADDHIETNCTNEELIGLAEETILTDDVERQPYRARHDGTKPVLKENLEGFMWKLVLWTYKGRLPESLDPTNRIYLAHWPNFTRLHPIPNQMRIAALLSRQPMEIGTIAELLKIPQRHVIAFYCATSAIGLAGQARRSADHMLDPEPLTSIDLSLPHRLNLNVAA